MKLTKFNVIFLGIHNLQKLEKIDCVFFIYQYSNQIIVHLN